MLGLAGALNTLLLAPYLAPLATPWPAPEIASGACPAERRLRVLTVNVPMTNKHDHRLMEIIWLVDPDIAWFQETDEWWESELAPLGTMMPQGAAQAQANYLGVHLFSRLPLEATEIRFLTGPRHLSALTTAALLTGEQAKVFAIHPWPPPIGQSTAERHAQLMAMALAASGDALPHVVTGDLNTVPWESALRRLQQLGGFGDPRVGRGLYMTWHAEHPLLRWPLDHVLPGPGWTLAALRVLPAFGSDHLPRWPSCADSLGRWSAGQPAPPRSHGRARLWPGARQVRPSGRGVPARCRGQRSGLTGDRTAGPRVDAQSLSCGRELPKVRLATIPRVEPCTTMVKRTTA